MNLVSTAFAVFGAAVFTWYVARHGLGWVWQKLKGTEQAAADDLAWARNAAQSYEQSRLQQKAQAPVQAPTGLTGIAPNPVPVDMIPHS